MFNITVENDENKEVKNVSITKQSDTCFWVSINTKTKRPEVMFGSGMDKDKNKHMSIMIYVDDNIPINVKISSDEIDMFSLYRGLVENRYGIDFIIFSLPETYEVIDHWSAD